MGLRRGGESPLSPSFSISETDKGGQIFSSDSTLYWSPSSSYLAFLSFDESDVPIYEYPVYNSNPNEVGGEEYPGKVEVPYPKVRMTLSALRCSC